jgi:hypothetical protein
MWNCVPLGMAQTKQVVRVGHAFLQEQGIAVPTFEPDPGEMRSVSEPPSMGARAFRMQASTAS